MTQKLILASPRGFCAGVERAIQIVEIALEKFSDQKIFVNHEIVHNKFVVQNFEARGVIFSDKIDEIPKNSIYIFSAHGVSPDFRAKAAAKNLKIIDATCPLVEKVHWEARKFAAENFSIFYIGQKNHQEFLGVRGVSEMILIENAADVEKINPEDFAGKNTVALSQTTLSQRDTAEILAALRKKFPEIRIPGDLCYATQNRQNAVEKLCKKIDFLAVIGSENSSNSQKLVSVAKSKNVPTELFDSAAEISSTIFEHKIVGITSGASVPDILVEHVVQKFRIQNPKIEIEIFKTKDESVKFPLPKI